MKLNIPTIRYWIAQKGVESDAELARRLGWTKATTSRFLAGQQRGIDPVKLAELATFLGRPEGELVELENVAQTPFEQAALGALKEADPDIKIAIRAILKLPVDIPLDP